MTQTGFQFLLLDTYNQLWILLREYIDSAARRSGQPSILTMSLTNTCRFYGM